MSDSPAGFVILDKSIRRLVFFRTLTAAFPSGAERLRRPRAGENYWICDCDNPIGSGFAARPGSTVTPIFNW